MFLQRATLKKFLDNRLKRFANMTPIFFDKRVFKIGKKFEKNPFSSDKLTNQFWLKKSYVASFFVEQFFYQLIC